MDLGGNLPAQNPHRKAHVLCKPYSGQDQRSGSRVADSCWAGGSLHKAVGPRLVFQDVVSAGLLLPSFPSSSFPGRLPFSALPGLVQTVSPAHAQEATLGLLESGIVIVVKNTHLFLACF